MSSWEINLSSSISNALPRTLNKRASPSPTRLLNRMITSTRYAAETTDRRLILGAYANQDWADFCQERTGFGARAVYRQRGGFYQDYSIAPQATIMIGRQRGVRHLFEMSYLLVHLLWFRSMCELRRGSSDVCRWADNPWASYTFDATHHPAAPTIAAARRVGKCVVSWP